jgi:hypothetical protein
VTRVPSRRARSGARFRPARPGARGWRSVSGRPGRVSRRAASWSSSFSLGGAGIVGCAWAVGESPKAAPSRAIESSPSRLTERSRRAPLLPVRVGIVAPVGRDLPLGFGERGHARRQPGRPGPPASRWYSWASALAGVDAGEQPAGPDQALSQSVCFQAKTARRPLAQLEWSVRLRTRRSGVRISPGVLKSESGRSRNPRARRL